MNKPDWKDAPDWANWLAMDRGGDWYWYEERPIARIPSCKWLARNKGKSRLAMVDSRDWLYSLKKRPEVPNDA